MGVFTMTHAFVIINLASLHCLDGAICQAFIGPDTSFHQGEILRTKAPSHIALARLRRPTTIYVTKMGFISTSPVAPPKKLARYTCGRRCITMPAVPGGTPISVRAHAPTTPHHAQGETQHVLVL